MARRFNRKPLTDEESDARRQADRERIEQAARALLTTDGWQRWIKIRDQRALQLVGHEPLPHQRGVLRARDHANLRRGFRAFLDLNRVVRKGEATIRILAPVTFKDRDERGEQTGERRVFFRAVHVWDVSMTGEIRCRSHRRHSRSRATVAPT